MQKKPCIVEIVGKDEQIKIINRLLEEFDFDFDPCPLYPGSGNEFPNKHQHPPSQVFDPEKGLYRMSIFEKFGQL